MGLFDKKTCDICGGEIGLLGNRKLEDGNCCKDCVRKLSPFFSGRRRATVSEIKQQIAYREDNERKLSFFHVTQTVTTPGGMNILLDSNASKFVVTRHSNLAGNPDIIDLNAVTAVEINVSENKEEKTTTDSEGNEVSFNPPQYEYEYTFDAVIRVNHAWFDEISFEVSGSEKPDNPGSVEYANCVNICHAIRCALMPQKYNLNYIAPFDSNECTCVVNNSNGNTNSAFQQVLQTVASTLTANNNQQQTTYVGNAAGTWTCPTCGSNVSGNFCVNCGTAKPANTSWFCPNCGTRVTGNFCVNCGTKKPV